MNITANKPTKDRIHTYLEDLIRNRFGVFLDVHHTQFTKENPGFSAYGKPLRARTAVFAYKSKEDAIAVRDNPEIKPVCVAISECAISDQFNKKVGLSKSLHRLYRELAAKEKMEKSHE
jgi:hypothetical protein